NSGLLSGQHQNESGTVLNRYNLRLSKGIASYSNQHQFSSNFLYQLPFGRGKAFGSGASGWVEKLIGSWQWNGILTAQSGYPVVPLVGSNRSGNGDARNPDVPNWNPVQRQGDSRCRRVQENRTLLRSQCFRTAAGRNLRKRAA